MEGQIPHYGDSTAVGALQFNSAVTVIGENSDH